MAGTGGFVLSLELAVIDCFGGGSGGSGGGENIIGEMRIDSESDAKLLRGWMSITGTGGNVRTLFV